MVEVSDELRCWRYTFRDMVWRPSKKVKSWNMRWQVWNAWNLETWKMGCFPTWVDPSGSVTELPMPWTCGGGCQNHWVNWDAKSLDLYRCFIMGKIQFDWRISPFDRNTLIETFFYFLAAQNQNQVYGKSHGKSVKVLAINDHVKLTKECLLPEDLAGFLPPLPRNLGRWSRK